LGRQKIIPVGFISEVIVWPELGSFGGCPSVLDVWTALQGCVFWGVSGLFRCVWLLVGSLFLFGKKKFPAVKGFPPIFLWGGGLWVGAAFVFSFSPENKTFL